jgi:hypothetical protein
MQPTALWSIVTPWEWAADAAPTTRARLRRKPRRIMKMSSWEGWCRETMAFLVRGAGRGFPAHPSEAVLFDFDGTILDTETPEFEEWRAAFRARGHDLTLEVWQHSVGTVGAYDPCAHLADLTGVPLDHEALRQAGVRAPPDALRGPALCSPAWSIGSARRGRPA